MKGYDYSAEGAYFVTICTHNRDCTFGGVIDGNMIFSEIGRIANECWLAIPKDLLNVALGEYQFMPDHVHGIVIIRDKDAEIVDGDSGRELIDQIPPGIQILSGNQIPPGKPIPPEIWLDLVGARFLGEIDWPLMKKPNQSLGKIIRHFKAKATKKIHDAGFCDFGWQKGYHDHIVRDECDLERFRTYIRNNPLRWSERNRKG